MSDAFDARTYLENYDGPDFRIMEVCGTHTHEIFRLGIRKLLPPQIELMSGPGCPVCVTPAGYIDEDRHQRLETRREVYLQLVDECRNHAVGVLEGGGNAGKVLFVLAGRAGVTVLNAVEGAADGVAWVVGVSFGRSCGLAYQFIVHKIIKKD